MNEQDLANVVNVFAVIFGMLFALILGYWLGHMDGEKHAKEEYDRYTDPRS